MRIGAEAALQRRWDRVADVVIVGAGGLPAAIMARNQGASVIVIRYETLSAVGQFFGTVQK